MPTDWCIGTGIGSVSQTEFDACYRVVSGRDDGLDLNFWTSDPFDEIPVKIALDFSPGGVFDFENGAIQGLADETFFLRNGTGIYHVGPDAKQRSGKRGF